MDNIILQLKYPSKYFYRNHKLTNTEELELWDELHTNMNIITAHIHSNMIYSINTKQIAYKIFIKKSDIQEIKQIETRQDYAITHKNHSEITELTNEIIHLKKDVKEMLRLIHELYEFETK